ncbi:MAG: hypothetical protein Q8K38_02070 [Burkholderiaceae bacterium]|nr:hypothetical protein [Burkholderiaceae bacterium]MDZ4144544.1 hypothetical protein [Burkholderiales bacterium]
MRGVQVFDFSGITRHHLGGTIAAVLKLERVNAALQHGLAQPAKGVED